MESEGCESEETHPDDPTGNGEPPSEPYEPQRDDPIPDESAESKHVGDDPDDRQQKTTDVGMAQRTQRRP